MSRITLPGLLQFAVLAALFVAVTPPLGAYMARVYGREPTAADRVFLPVERLLYRLCGVDAEREQRWTGYALSFLALSAVSWLLLYLLLRLQGLLPLNPEGQSAVPTDVAFNTATSFTSHTNFQNYTAESTLSHLTQMVGLTLHNFLAAGAAIAILAALVRGFARAEEDTIGNFWVDLVRGIVRILLPLSLLAALLLVGLGVVQNFHGFTPATTVEGAVQAIPGGPAASQIAIKHLGTNGGGFFAANSAHPFENPGPVSNVIEMFLLAAIPFALTYTFGSLVRSRRDGWVLFAVMFGIWAISAVLAMSFESRGNPQLTAVGIEQSIMAVPPGGNLEGKEVRFGPAGSGLFAATTTGTAGGAVNSTLDSYTPLGGLVPMFDILIGEVAPGGVGVGMIGMLVMALLSVFIAGLMVGRTPEYLGKKIEFGEIKLVVLYLLAVPVAVLALSAISVLLPSAVENAGNAPGPHGFSEIVYAFASPANNNGSAFGGLRADAWFNVAQSVAYVFGRWLLLIPVLAVAGSLVGKQKVPATKGTFPTGTPTFAMLVFAVVLITVGLVYFPIFSLGPLAEHLSL